MKKRIFTILGWALIALAVGGLFILAADLPAKGYELRFEEPLSVLQANSLSKAAEYLGLNLALWKEDSETVTNGFGTKFCGTMHFCVWQPDPLLPGGLSVRERTGGRPVGWMCGQCRSGRCTFWKS